MPSASTTLVFIFIVIAVIGILSLERSREKRISNLLLKKGKKSIATVTEYSEGEDGYHVTYQFMADTNNFPIERTETLKQKPQNLPAVGDLLTVSYLQDMPSISRLNLDIYKSKFSNTPSQPPPQL